MKYKYLRVMQYLVLSVVCIQISAQDYKFDTTVSLEDFKKPDFIKEQLPNDFSPIADLLQKGVTAHQSPEYARSVFMMFSNMLHGAEYVNPIALYLFMQRMSEILPYYITPHKTQKSYNKNMTIDLGDIEQFKELTYNIMYGKFTHEFDDFRQMPTQFLDKLSQNMADVTQEAMDIVQLQNEIVRFLEISTSKLVWNPERHENVWRSVRALSVQMGQLTKDNVIQDVSDLDKLYWVLTRRFCFFLDIASAELPITFIQEIRTNINTQPPLLIKLEEQEQCIETKQACLTRNLIEIEAKLRAQDIGIITR